ncbi:P-loop containing nucleoside triphosphate hydrolase protein [Sparassis latifolia]
MARRVMSAASDDSQKENSGVRKRVKLERLRQKRAAKLTGIAARQRAVSVEDDEDAEGEDELDDLDDTQGQDEDAAGEEAREQEEEDEEGASPRGRKRVRTNAEGDSRPTEVDVKPKAEKKEKSRTLPRDVDGFTPGAIVRVQLKNFVTYDYVEFCPGPYLNMIFGPNGTGKSTIACAICLGLNFPPSVLGRASELNSFVKIGTESGHIEIELKGLMGKSNLVVRRMLSAKSKSSTFTLNGQSASGKEINARMAELNVQVSNLCTFLPQDKVSEFASMSPQQLLRETQRAAGNAHLTSWHDSLISSGKELKQMQDVLDADRDQLKTMQERNANLERDVRRYEERRRIEREIDLLELILPFKQYMEAKDLYHLTKAAQRRLHDKVKALQAKNAPMLKLKADLTREMQEKDEAREDRKKGTKKKLQGLHKKYNDNEKLETDAEDLKTKLETLKESEKQRKRNIERAEKAIAHMQKQLDNPPEMGDLDDLNNQLRNLSTQNNAIRNEQSDLQEKQRLNVQEESRQKTTIQQQQQRLKELDDVSHRKLEDLARWDRDCADVVRWLRNNKQRFRMELFEPPMLCCTVPDKKYVHAVEACFNQTQMKTFVAQCEEDYQLLNRLVVDTPEALGRKVRINTWYRAKTQLVGPPMSEQEMHVLGFDGYALQYLVYPEGLKWFLQNSLQLHRTAISLDAGRVDPNRAMEMVSRYGPGGSGGGASYVCGDVFNTVQRSRYGKRLPQNMTREVRPARNLVHSAIDPEIKQRIDTILREANQKLTLCQEEAKTLTDDDARIREEHRQHKRQHDDIISRRNAVVDLQKKFESFRYNIEKEQTKVNDLRSMPSVEDERIRLRSQLVVLTKKRADIVKDFSKIIRSVITTQQEATRIGLEYLQVAANKTALEAMCQDQEEEYQKAVAEFNDAHRRYEVAKEDSKLKLRVSMAKLDEVDDEIRAKFKDMEDSGEANARSAEDVQADLDAKKAQLDMNLHTNAGVVEQFRKREQEIKVLTETIEDKEKKMERVDRTIKTARDHWQPALDELVASIGTRFSAAFDRLGCAGEVRISEHEDYDKWAIEIFVKFRDSEKLQLLTGERQSGGERSLTTILYLMSLTEEARAPFSLVDEINQGMDQRAERAVHNSLVEVTCKAESGQYFLITPKLLPDLNYAERMKVLCVNNGEWLPEESGIGNMMNMIEGYVKLHSGRAVSSA